MNIWIDIHFSFFSSIQFHWKNRREKLVCKIRTFCILVLLVSHTWTLSCLRQLPHALCVCSGASARYVRFNLFRTVFFFSALLFISFLFVRVTTTMVLRVYNTLRNRFRCLSPTLYHKRPNLRIRTTNTQYACTTLQRTLCRSEDTLQLREPLSDSQ